MNKSLIIGITGGSGAGKSTLCQRLVEKMGLEKVTYISLDKYMYKDAPTNNTPEAISFLKLHQDIDKLMAKEKVVLEEEIILNPAPIILLEGHLLMCDSDLKKRLDLSIYVDLDKEERLLRRIERNVGYGMDLQGIIDWYRKDVKDNYVKYVEPAKKECDLIIWGEIDQKKVDLLADFIESLARKKTVELE